MVMAYQAHYNAARVKCKVSEYGRGRLVHHHLPLATFLQASSFLGSPGIRASEVLRLASSLGRWGIGPGWQPGHSKTLSFYRDP